MIPEASVEEYRYQVRTGGEVIALSKLLLGACAMAKEMSKNSAFCGMLFDVYDSRVDRVVLKCVARIQPKKRKI